MKTVEEIKTGVKRIVKQMAYQQGIDIPELQDHHAVVNDLHFSSLDVATLTALFQREFGVNPFLMGIAAITEIRTINEIAEVYARGIAIKENPELQSRETEVNSNRSESRKAARTRKRLDD